MAYSRAAGSAFSSCTVRRSPSEAVTTNLVRVGSKLSLLKISTEKSVSTSTRTAALRWIRPPWSSTASRKRRSSPAEPPTIGMPSSAQAMAEITVSSALASPSIRDSAKRSALRAGGLDVAAPGPAGRGSGGAPAPPRRSAPRRDGRWHRAPSRRSGTARPGTRWRRARDRGRRPARCRPTWSSPATGTPGNRVSSSPARISAS